MESTDKALFYTQDKFRS